RSERESRYPFRGSILGLSSLAIGMYTSPTPAPTRETPAGTSTAQSWADRRIEQRLEPRAVDDAERVVVFLLRPALKDRQPVLDVNRHEVERVADRRARKLSGKHRFEDLQTGTPNDLVGPCDADVGREPRAHGIFLGLPSG